MRLATYSAVRLSGYPLEAGARRQVGARRSLIGRGKLGRDQPGPDVPKRLAADFTGAMETARRFGCGLIIYDEP